MRRELHLWFQPSIFRRLSRWRSQTRAHGEHRQDRPNRKHHRVAFRKNAAYPLISTGHRTLVQNDKNVNVPAEKAITPVQNGRTVVLSPADPPAKGLRMPLVHKCTHPECEILTMGDLCISHEPVAPSRRPARSRSVRSAATAVANGEMSTQMRLSGGRGASR
jgi:hypothetical protein